MSTPELKFRQNPLLNNPERAVFTFNMHNLAEICFEQV